MQNMKIVKDPGYISDLLFVFFLQYNKEYCIENFVNKKREKEDKAFYEQIVKEFAPTSDDLYVFFHALENGQCCITYNYFYAYRELFASTYNMAFLQDQLSDYPEVIKNVMRFYFHDLTTQEMDACINSHATLFDMIKKSDYSDTEKSRLYEFFIDPFTYIRTLQQELMVTEVQLRLYYEKNYTKIFDTFNKLTFDVLKTQLSPLYDLSFINEDGATLFLSVSLINKRYIKFHSHKDWGVFMLGIDYLESVEDTLNRESCVKLDEFSNALSEESRVKMLDLMLENGEITCKDLERIFNFSGSTAYHHLTILMRYGAIKTRNEGKTILYSINTKNFDAAIEQLAKYSSRKRAF